MPTYEYACSNCGTNHEIQQKMSDPTLTDCPTCGQPTLRKLFSGVGIHFKGSGFYRTDSRGKASTGGEATAGKATKSAGSDSSSSGSSGGSSSSSGSSGGSGSSSSSSSSSSGSSSSSSGSSSSS